MKDTDYAAAVARVRINENNLLTNADIDRLIGVKDLSEAVALLNDKGYSSPGEPIENLFSGQMEKAWELIKEVAPDFSEFDFMLVKNDFHNLKAVLKGIVTDKEFGRLCLHPTITPIDDIERAIKEQRFEILPEYMRQTAAKAYDCFVSTGDGQLSDLVIDRGALAAVVSLSGRSKDSFIRGLGELTAATYNLRIAVRSAKIGQSADNIMQSLCPVKTLDNKALIQAAGEGIEALEEYILTTAYSAAAEQLKISVSAFEKWCDNALINYIEPVKYSCFGIAPLAAYIIKKEAELKTVRIIVSGKSVGMSEEAIRNRIRRVC